MPSHSHRMAHKRGRGCLAVLIALAIIGGGGYFVVSKGVGFLANLSSPAQDYSGEGRGSVVVEIPESSTLTEIGRLLKAADVVASVDAFIEATAANAEATSIQSGYYEMRKKMSAEAALSLLISGQNRVETVVTVPEGLTVEQTLAVIAKSTDIPLKKLKAAATAPKKLGLPGYAGNDLEGFLFPATYTLPPKLSATDVLTMMVDRFEQAADDVALVAGAKGLGYSPEEILTVASIVQREARMAQDFGKVSRVIYNRLDSGIALGMDSTVQFANDTVGELFTTDEERNIDSPYNTYKFPGLPPGAISAPGEDALKAALDPTPGSWVYFVTVNIETGKTLFATTLDDHNRNVAKLTAYCNRSDLC